MSAAGGWEPEDRSPAPPAGAPVAEGGALGGVPGAGEVPLGEGGVVADGEAATVRGVQTPSSTFG